MKPLRIILVMLEPPLPFGRAVGRWYYVLYKGLLERGHDVMAIAACSQPDELEQVRRELPASHYDLRCVPTTVQSGWRSRLRTLQQPHHYAFSDELRATLKTELERGYDVLHLEDLWTGWLGIEHARKAVLSLHYLFSIDWSDSPSRGVFDRVRHMATVRAEQSLLQRYRSICTLTPRLSRRVRELSPTSAVHTIPLCLDLSLYPFERNGGGAAPTIGLIGSFHWRPSYTAGVRLLTRLWPEIKRQVPEARLMIAGREANTAFAQYLGRPDIEILDNVHDILPCFRRCDVLLYAPGRGSGMKVKVLEAFALGVPVVTTSEGIEGLLAEDGVQAAVCEDDAGLIQRTVVLLNDDARRSAQACAARRLVEETCSPHIGLNAVERVYQTLN